MQTTIICFVLFLLKEYRNLPIKDIKYTTSQNLATLGKVYPLHIIEFWNRIQSS